MRHLIKEVNTAMEIRVLKYFLAVAREESFSRAAGVLHLSQPTLSRQIKDMENELGVTLLVRGSRSVTLTREGMHMRKRAEEMIELMDKTVAELSEQEQDIGGDIYIGSGETHIMRRIARVAVALQREYPGIHYHLFSGNADDVGDRLEKGLLDFGVMIEPAPIHKYDYIQIPGKDMWGLLMPATHPLSKKESISPQDMWGLPLLVSRQSILTNTISGWLGMDATQLTVVATYNLVYNAALMVEQGMGCALCLDHLVNVQDHSGICFRPFAPRLEASVNLMWKKYQVFSPACELFLSRIQADFDE